MSNAARNEALNKISSLFSFQKLAVLSTCGENGPYANLIAFVETEDLKAILFATSEKSAKYHNMTVDNRVAVLVENSRNHVDDFQNAVAVAAMGRVEALKEEARTMMITPYLMKHPNLEAFVNAPGCALMKVSVEAYTLVESLEQAVRISMKD